MLRVIYLGLKIKRVSSLNLRVEFSTRECDVDRPRFNVNITPFRRVTYPYKYKSRSEFDRVISKGVEQVNGTKRKRRIVRCGSIDLHDFSLSLSLFYGAQRGTQNRRCSVRWSQTLEYRGGRNATELFPVSFRPVSKTFERCLRPFEAAPPWLWRTEEDTSYFSTTL